MLLQTLDLRGQWETHKSCNSLQVKYTKKFWENIYKSVTVLGSHRVEQKISNMIRKNYHTIL